jgi:hypothetical protein
MSLSQIEMKDQPKYGLGSSNQLELPTQNQLSTRNHW